MKSPKSYYYRFATLLIVIGSAAFLYWFGYHKTFDPKCIPQNADGIIMVDVKNIRNYYVVSCLKNPSEWQWNRGESKFEKLFNSSGFGLEKPDYFAFFHIENQPLTQWFVCVKIKNEAAFEKAATEAHFTKTTLSNGMSSYYSKSLVLFIIRYSNQILISNIAEKQTRIAAKTAEDLFLKKYFLDIKKIEKTIDTKNAATFWIKKNSFLEKDGILNLKLKDQEITIDGLLQLKPKLKKEWQFAQNPNALLSLGFNFEMIRAQRFFKQHSAQINKMIGFDLDSVLVHNPTKTELVLNEIIEKKDSSISYDYDDDFNPIKKVAVSTNREPSFSFTMHTADSKKVYNYLKTQNAIDNHNIFVNFLLAKTKTSIQNTALIFEANHLTNWPRQTSAAKIGYFDIHLEKLQTEDWRYLIAKNKNFRFLQPFKTLTIDFSPKNDLSHFQVHLKTKDRKNLVSVMK